jgi:hypothetical protein
MIEDIEQFGSELDVFVFGDTEILEDREIPIRRSGTDSDVAAGVSELLTGELGSEMTCAKAARLSHALVVFGPELGLWPDR